MTLLVSLPSPLNHGVTLSQSHAVTRGGGSVISVTKCDKAGGRSAVTPYKDKAHGGLLSHSIPI